MPETADRQRGLWGVIAAVLMLLLPGSVAMQLSLRPSEPTSAESSPGSEKTDARDSSESCGPSRPDAACPLKSSPALSLLASYYNLDLCACKPDPAAARGSLPCQETGAESRHSSSRLERLFALVPEKSWGLDGAIESIVRAYESAGYTLVRKSLPWSSGDSSETSPGQNIPGVLLFNRDTGPSTHSQIVYLVEETPAGGVREGAMEAAFSDWEKVSSLMAPDGAQELRILGPTFSGSAVRLGRMIARSQEKNPSARGSVRVLSGSATSDAAGAGLEQAYWRAESSRKSAVGLTFRTTVRSDGEMKEAMWKYLTQELRITRDRIALIVESSTGYGQSARRAGDARSSSPFEGSMLLPVPYNLSQLEAEWNKRGRNRGPQPTENEQQKTLGRLHDSASRRGALPIFDRGTLTTRDLTLAALLSTICQQGIQFVGLMLTDPGDKRFLAQRIGLECPDVRLFSFESEIDYLHREDYPSLRGMLVATSYPLYSRNQQWSSAGFYRNSQLLQFARQPDQGIYNAMLLLLERHDLLQEYAPPTFKRTSSPCGPGSADSGKPSWDCLRPPVWISAVGRQGLIPLRAYEDFSNESEYVARVAPPLHRQAPSASKPFDLGTIHILLLLFTGAALLHAWAYFGSRYGQLSRNEEPGSLRASFAFLRAAEPRPSLYLLALLIPIAGVLLYLMLVLALRFRPGNLMNLAVKLRSDGSFIEDLLYTVSALLGIVGTVMAALDVLLLQSKRLQRSWSRIVSRTVQSPGLRAAAALLGVAALATLTLLFYRQIEGDPTAILFLRRSSQTAYELSPLIPGMFFCGVIYLWGLNKLRTLHRLQDQPLTAPIGIRSEGRATDRPVEELQSLLRTTPRRTWLLACIGTLLATLPVLRRLNTVDHWILSLGFRTLFWLCTLLVVLSLIRILRGWLLLRTLLDRVAHHPLSGALTRVPPVMARPLGSLALSELPAPTEQAITQRQCLVLQDAYAKVDASQRRAWEADPEHEERAVWQIEDGNERASAGALDAAAPRLARFLVKAGVWPQEGRLRLPPPDEEPASAEGRFFRRVEDLLAVRLVAFLCHVLSHLRSAMLFISLSLILMLLALNSYPFQPMQWLTIMVWLLFLGAMTLSGYVLVQMNRDPVLGLISHGQPSGLTWDATFVRQLAIFILAPLLSLVATRIPALSWIPKLLQNLK